MDQVEDQDSSLKQYMTIHDIKHAIELMYFLVSLSILVLGLEVLRGNQPKPEARPPLAAVFIRAVNSIPVTYLNQHRGLIPETRMQVPQTDIPTSVTSMANIA